MSWCLHMVTCHVVECRAPYSLGQYWKTDVVAAFSWQLATLEIHSLLKKVSPWYSGKLFQHKLDRRVRSWKRWVPGTAGSCFNTNSTDGWEAERWTAVSLYLNELLIQKCKFRGRFKVSRLYLERYSPKGSCHLDESSMNHSLAQKHLCEFCCGMHRTCKNTSVKPNRS